MTNNKNYFNRGIVAFLANTDILQLGEIIRYSNKTKIKDENVAEHSFYVAQTALEICEKYNIQGYERLKALEFCIVHDIPEGAGTGDVGYDVKQALPELVVILTEAEKVAMRQVHPILAATYEEYLENEAQDTVPGIVTKLADAVSVLKYSERELKLGNQFTQMKEINESAYLRVNTLVNKLEAKLGLNK